MIKKLTVKSIFVFFISLFFTSAVAVFAEESTDTVTSYPVPPARVRGEEVREGRMVSMEGELTCLPHRDSSGGVTMECALGLYGKNGNYYSLENLNQDDFVSGRLRTGQIVRVTGMLIPDSSGPYAIAGSINVRSLVRLGVVERRESPVPPAPNAENASPGEAVQPTVLQKRAEFHERMEAHREVLRSRATEMKQRVTDRREELRTQW